MTSTIYHALPRRLKAKEILRRFDHAAIYWHIAGSYSPITLIAMRDQGYWGWALFCFVWLCAIAGTTISFIHLKEHSNVETFCFIGMGLSVLIAFKPLLACVSTAAVIWIVAEGICYITGAAFYSLNKTKYMHSVFHFFVLAGSICHICRHARKGGALGGRGQACRRGNVRLFGAGAVQWRCGRQGGGRACDRRFDRCLL